jgi:hypothetical protein
MNTLTTKLQYISYEHGEYDDIRQSTLDEAYAIIERFPWEEQSKGLIVGLTCPSVTFERADGAYLKLGAYYHGTWCLYLFTPGQGIYERPLPTVKESYEFIQTFYANTEDHRQYKHDPLVIQPIRHFATEKFEYAISPKRIVSHIGMSMAFFLFLIFIFAVNPGGIHDGPLWMDVLVVLLIFPPISGLSFFAFTFYYLDARKKLLIMSQGHDIFYYGNRGNLITYKKSEIVQWFLYTCSAYQSPLGNYSYSEILFRNGTKIRINSLLLGKIGLKAKCPGIPFDSEKVVFPIMWDPGKY